MRPRTLRVLAGAVHGAAEMVPVSSSAHVALVLGGSLPDTERKAFEVALHAGSLPVLASVSPRPRPWFAALTLAPPAVAGLLLHDRIARISGPRALAAGVLAGTAALGVTVGGSHKLFRHDAGAADALAIGVAQAAALWPGVSRTGATVAAARLRGFAPDAAYELSREAALPVVVAATALEVSRGARPEPLPLLAAAAGALAARPLARRSAILPWVAYRACLAAVLLRNLRRR